MLIAPQGQKFSAAALTCVIGVVLHAVPPVLFADADGVHTILYDPVSVAVFEEGVAMSVIVTTDLPLTVVMTMVAATL